MKPGFLTDSFPVEFLNQVHNKRKKKRLRRKVHVGILILEIVYVALENLIMLISGLCSKLQILGS